MGITRSALPFESDFVRIPNAWVRDQRLSRRARGILCEIMSHAVGWHVTIASLQKSGPEGRDAVRGAVDELKACGYLRLKQSRGAAGRWNEIEYELCEPMTGVGKPDSGGFTDSGSADGGSADIGKSDTKKTSTSEDHSQEDHEVHVPNLLDRFDGGLTFEDFWDVWPKKFDQPDARKAWTLAVRTTPPRTILEAGLAYRDNPGIPDQQFIPNPGKWLRRGGWAEDLPQRPRSEMGVMDRNLQVLAQLEANERATANIVTVHENSVCAEGQHRRVADGTCLHCTDRLTA